MTLNSPAAPFMNVLVVDNEVCFLQLMRRLLSREGLEAECVGSITEARETVTSAHSMNWDLIFVDLNLPDGDGISFTRYIRERGYTGSVILCSGSLSPTLRTRAEDAGANGLLTKPFALDELRQWIEKVQVQDSDTTQEECLWAS